MIMLIFILVGGPGWLRLLLLLFEHIGLIKKYLVIWLFCLRDILFRFSSCF